MKFTKQQDEVWEALFNRQLPNIKRFACKEYLDGFQALQLPSSHIPTVEELNAIIFPKTGWRIVHTDIRYLTALQWAEFISTKTFPVTKYMRGINELDFTPEPDMFHDIFGHLPFLMNEDTLVLTNLFAEMMAKADQQKLVGEVAKLWWFSVEFGLIQEGSEVKTLGTGLMSSFGETLHVMRDDVIRKAFTIPNAIATNPAVYSFHDGYFVVDSIQSLISDLTLYKKTI